jgi:hypothetical protein
MHGKLAAAALLTLGFTMATTLPAQAHNQPMDDGAGPSALIGSQPEPVTAPLGSTKGSFVDASLVYGAAH